MFLVILLSGAFGGFTALMLGLPALRIRGLFLAVTTLSFAVAFDRYFLSATNFPDLIKSDINRPMLFGGRWDVESDLVMYHLILIFLVLSVLLVNSVRGTRSGRVLIATRDNHRAASAAAVAPTTAKLTGFVFSGVIAGIAGCFMVLQLRGTAEGTFSPAMSLEVFSTAVIGGLGTVFGALLGVLTFRWLEQILSGEARLILTGAGLLFVLMVIPAGLSSVVFAWRDRYLRWVARRRGIPVPSLTEDKRLVEGEEAEEDALAEVDFGEVLEASQAVDEPAEAEVVSTKGRAN
jgi:branched-chain amino acid transport system permease protein